MTPDSQWTAVDAYVNRVLTADDEALTGAIKASETAGLPAISVTPQQGKLLHTLARAIHARAILEIGTLGGYSTIWLARAIAPGGLVPTIEGGGRDAEGARRNNPPAGVGSPLDPPVGPAPGGG